MKKLTKLNPKCAPFPQFTLHTQSTTTKLDNPSHQRKTKTSSLPTLILPNLKASRSKVLEGAEHRLTNVNTPQSAHTGYIGYTQH